MAERLRDRAAERGLRVAVVGPAPAYIARRADRWRWNVVLRGDDPVALLDAAARARRGPWTSTRSRCSRLRGDVTRHGPPARLRARWERNTRSRRPERQGGTR